MAILRDGRSRCRPDAGWFLPVPLWVRLPAAAAFLAWGAWGNRRWTVPLVMVLAMPVLWLNSLAVLVALSRSPGSIGADPHPAANQLPGPHDPRHALAACSPPPSGSGR